jgi:hypothetical protein
MNTQKEQFSELAKTNGAKESYFTKHEMIAVFLPPFSNAQSFQIELEELLYNASDEGETLANIIYDGAIVDMVIDEDHEYCEIVLIAGPDQEEDTTPLLQALHESQADNYKFT